MRVSPIVFMRDTTIDLFKYLKSSLDGLKSMSRLCTTY
jgi:hypothetical protein